VESPTRAARISELEGQRLGPYEIVAFVGRGGMAVVYKALQPALRRHVAIKVLPPYFVHEEGFRARFQQEAETVAHLEHPNILPIYDFGQEGDVPYIVMPLVSGGTLRDWLAKPVALERALQVFSRILAALEYAHGQRVVHRDIKPSNILMSQGDWPLLTDFGIAKIVEPSLRVTRSGTMVGTPEYMSPEQSQGGLVDHRADLYAMGIILYEMLTGRLPFEGQTPLAVILQHVRDEVPPPSTMNPSLSPVWDEVIRRALAKDPNDRYPSAQAMDDALQTAWQQVRRESGEWQTVPGTDPSVLYHSAARALAEGDWQRVISLCGQLLEIDPAHPEAVRLLTQAHEALRRQRAADRGARAEELLRQADEAMARERFAEAVENYHAALQYNPGLETARRGLERAQRERDHEVLYRKAQADVAAERWDEAAARLEQLLSSAPDYRDAAALRARVASARERQARLVGWYDLGVAALARQDWAGAVQALEHVVGAAPGYRDAAARLAEARQAAEVDATLARARATLAAGQAEAAAALLETVVGRLPGQVEARTLLAQARAAGRARSTLPRPEAAAPAAAESAGSGAGSAAEATSVGPPSGLELVAEPSATDGTGPAAAAAAPALVPDVLASVPIAEPAADSDTLSATPVTAAPVAAADVLLAPSAADPAAVSDTRPLVPAAEPAVGEAVARPAEIALAAPAARRSPGWKLAVAGGLAATAIIGAVLWQRSAPAAAPITAERSVAAAPTITLVPTAVPPTAVPTPSAADLFPACESAVAASAWSEALAACEQVFQKDPDYDGLADVLATTYLALGEEQVAQGAPLAEAIAQFDKALAAKPNDAEAEQQRAWALAYQDGQDALAAENWPLATEKLEQVYTVAPDYRGSVDGGVKQALYAARLGWGQALLAAGSYADAREKCQQALGLVPDSQPATDCQAKAVAALTPPTPVPAPAPVYRPAPTAVPRAPVAAPAPSHPAPSQPAPPARNTSSQPAAPAYTAPAPAAPQPPTRAPAVAAPPTRAPAVDTKPPFTPRY